MKVVFQAVIGSIAIYVIFLVGMMVIGYIKTRIHKPNIADMWDDKVMELQNEVVFGKIISPPFGLFLASLKIIGIAVVLGIIIFTYNKLFS